MSIQRKINLSPYKELKFGTESIYDYVDENFQVNNKVITYLRIGQPHLFSFGVYDHPFKPGVKLSGPYILTDNTRYTWDRDLWKYVQEYHVRLPQEFIDYVMSGAGDNFIRENNRKYI